ncbi:MAG: hypothetical protein AAFP78_01045, partial [Pseudomonadota bacterium]
CAGLPDLDARTARYVDLHVYETLANGQRRHYYHGRKNQNRSNYPDSPASLSFDVTRGPGIEVWETSAFVDGAVYEFELHYYGAYDGASSSVTVDGRIYHGEGYATLLDRTIDVAGPRNRIRVIRVRANSNRLDISALTPPD